jgi:hypothetical protein
MKRILLFKFLFSITIIIIFLSISSQLFKNISPQQTISEFKEGKTKLQRVDINLIKSLIKKGELSDKEAMYYEIINSK